MDPNNLKIFQADKDEEDHDACALEMGVQEAPTPFYIYSPNAPPSFPDVTDRLQEKHCSTEVSNFGLPPFATEVAHSLLFNSGLAG